MKTNREVEKPEEIKEVEVQKAFDAGSDVEEESELIKDVD